MTPAKFSAIFLASMLCVPFIQAQDRGGRPDFNNGGFQGGRGMRPNRTSNAPLTLNGIIGSGDAMELSITNPETRESHWVKLRDRNAKWYVESANFSAKSCVVRLDGIALKLQMVGNTGESMSIAPQPVQLSANEAAMAARNGSLSPKDVLDQLQAIQAAGQRPTPEQMNQFRQQMDAMTPEQRTQFFQGIRQEIDARGGPAAFMGAAGAPMGASMMGGFGGNAAAAPARAGNGVTQSPPAAANSGRNDTAATVGRPTPQQQAPAQSGGGRQNGNASGGRQGGRNR